MQESLRVLKTGGLLVTAYIPRYYIFQYLVMKDPCYLETDFEKQLIDTGIVDHRDKNCFWTDSYYSSKNEMEEIYHKNGLEVIDHFAQDGMTPQFANVVDNWTEEQFRVWCEHHYRVCRNDAVLNASNHVIIIGRKH